MSTGNFAYNNRCIVVTNEDYEGGNYPELGAEDSQSNRNYPSKQLDEQPSDFFIIILTSGYYDAACIDYRQDERANLSDYINVDSPAKEKIKWLSKRLKWSQKKIKEQINNHTGLRDFNQAEDWEQNDIINLLFSERNLEIEEAKVNKYLDELKKEYGFKEYKVSARFSNGETMYKEV